MCVKPSLNPNAEEWRPTSHSPFPAAPPPPPHTLGFVSSAPSPPQELLYTLPRPSFFLPHEIYAHFRHSFHYLSVPTDRYKTESTQSEKTKTDSTESPRKSDHAVFCQTGKRRYLPPRLRYFVAGEHHPPSPSKKVWKPKSPLKSRADLPPPSILPSPQLSAYTTVMIKNIPNQFRRDFFLNFLDGLSRTHSLEYDFLYLPMDFRRKHNLGYAFLNLTSAGAAQKFQKVLENHSWGVVQTDNGPVCSTKICVITWARIQGKEALHRRFQNANFTCDELDFLPVVLDPARDGTDPNPPPPVVVGRLCGLRN